MEHDLWKPKRRIETMYQNALKRALQKLENLIADITDPFKIIDTIMEFAETQEYQDYSESLATKIITNLFSDAGRTWRTAANYNSKGKILYSMLHNEMYGPLGADVYHLIKLNSKLIGNIPHDMAKYLTQYILEGAFVGRRASDIAEELKKLMPGFTNTRAQLIARTETSKASTALTRARSERAGINWYVWRTSQDGRVRDSHRHMEGVLVNWRDPPSPEALDNKKTYGKYNAGDTFNCRCYPEPLVSLNLISWPHKVYSNGKIVNMTRAQFERIM